jgi:hypothetical protein
MQKNTKTKNTKTTKNVPVRTAVKSGGGLL